MVLKNSWFIKLPNWAKPTQISDSVSLLRRAPRRTFLRTLTLSLSSSMCILKQVLIQRRCSGIFQLPPWTKIHLPYTNTVYLHICSPIVIRTKSWGYHINFAFLVTKKRTKKPWGSFFCYYSFIFTLNQLAQLNKKHTSKFTGFLCLVLIGRICISCIFTSLILHF